MGDGCEGSGRLLARSTIIDTRLTSAYVDDVAVATAVDAGCSWADIGRALGVSAQAAHRRFRWLRYSPVTGEVWREPPLPV
jgi:hypothetical protein